MARRPTTKIAGEVFAVTTPERMRALEEIARAARALIYGGHYRMPYRIWSRLIDADECLKASSPRRPSGGRVRR